MPPEQLVLQHAEDDAAPTTMAGVASRTIDLSIVIVSWNTRDLLRDCLESIAANDCGLDIEVIVVDNNSSDGSAAMIADEFPEVRLIANRTNAGFSKAGNQGMRRAGGRYILLLNPDTVILGDVLVRAMEYAQSHPDVGVLGCQVMEDDDRIQRTCFRFPSPVSTLLWMTGVSAWRPRSPVVNRASYGSWDRTTEREVDVVSGMFMLVPRRVLDEVGLMDERYFVFGEEADWCRRIWQAGWRCVFAPVGRVLHVNGGSKSTDQVSVRMYVEMHKSLLLFARKNRGVAQWAVVKALFCCSMPLRAVWWSARTLLGIGEGSRERARQSVAAARFHWTGAEPALMGEPGSISLPCAAGRATDPHSPPQLDCEILTSFDDAEHLHQAWDALVEGVGSPIYQTFDWCRVWWECYGQGREARIFIFRDGGRIIGIVPMFIDRVRLGPFGLRVAKIVGSDFTQSVCDLPIITARATEAIEQVLQSLITDDGCDAVSFNPMSEAYGRVDHIRQAWQDCRDLVVRLRDDVVSVHTRIELPSTIDEYLAQLSRKERQSIRKGWNHLHRDFECRSEVVSEHPETSAEFDAFVRMHGEQWNAKHRLGHFADWPLAEHFNRRMVRVMSARGRVRLHRLTADNEVIARQYCYVFGGECFWRLPARVSGAEWQHYCLGRVGLVAMFRHLIDEGVCTVGAGVGSYDYKRRLGGREHDVRSMLLVANNRRSLRRARRFCRAADLLDRLYYRLYFLRIAPRLPGARRPLWTSWIKSRL